MLPVGDANAYALARRTLVEAVIALHDLAPEAFVLVGAHAVYLRAPENDLAALVEEFGETVELVAVET